VRLQTLERGSVGTTSEFVGALEAQQRVLLRPEAAGRVAEILVASGDRVEAGEPILQLRPNRPQAEVTGALANVTAARAASSSAEAELRAAEADRGQAAADLKLQNEEYQRTRFLEGEGAQSQQELDRVESRRDTAIAALDAAQQRIAAARSALSESQAALNQAEAETDVAREDLGDYRILAPVSGVIGDIPVKIGDYVDVGELLTTLTQNDTLELRLAIPIERSFELETGLPVELRVPQQEQPLVTGKIDFVSPRVDGNDQSILAKASFPNPAGRLRDGQFVQARIVWERQSGVLVPTTAVTHIGDQGFVYVARPSQAADGENLENEGALQLVAAQRPVELGTIRGNNYQVLKGLQAGERVVVSGLLSLSDGALIQPEQAETVAAESE
jgi:RND family efflux transporter MFP subunit